MIDYSKTKIYKITCNETHESYIFYTTTRFVCQRLNTYRVKYYDYKCGYNKRFHPIFNIFKGNNYSIELIENYPCHHRHEIEYRIFEINKNNFLENKNKIMNDENEPKRTRYELILEIEKTSNLLQYPKLKYVHAMSKKQLLELYHALNKEYKSKTEFYSKLNNK